MDATLQLRLPSNEQELEAASMGFSTISQSNGLFDGCIGAIDGWLCTTCQPIDSDIIDKRSYFSGHYQRFGLNIQAICDSRLRFIYFAVAAPGRTNDARAFLKCHELRKWIDNVLSSTKYYFVGDNAYVLCDELLIPYSGTHIPEIERTYNFFLSQMRIRIEMAFGRLTTKWRIFRRDLEFSMRHSSLICRCAAKLHNFVIDEALVDGINQEDIEPFDGAPRGLGYLETAEEADDDERQQPVVGFSIRRSAIIDQIGLVGLSRPMRNIQRNG